MTDEMGKSVARIELESMDDSIGLFGVFDENLNVFEEEIGVQIRIRSDGIAIEGDEEQVNLCRTVLEKLLDMQRKGEPINRGRIRYAIDIAKDGNAELIKEIMGDVVALTNRGKQIKCKTLGQKKYIQALKTHELVFGVGPAGTGKTYLAVAMAVVAFKNKEVERIILTRPAVEAGEKLGFLPGDMTQKIDPYLRPLYDALYDTMGADAYARLTERGVLEVAPLAFMRGRTLAHSFIILDEAQNTTPEQMKMFLTRIGLGSRCVVTGDVSQIDLPNARMSGLVQAMEVLREETAVGMIRLTEEDVVRHELVRRIVAAYQKYEAARQRS